MKKFIPFVILCFLLQGCVGVVVPKTQTTVISDPAVYISAGIDHVCSRSAPGRTDEWYRPDVTNGWFTTQCTEEWLKQNWGSPAHVCSVSGASGEIWTYKFDTVWEGVVPIVIIPIPLMLPVAHEKVCFSLHDRRVVSASITKSIVVGGTYGFIPNPEGGGSFGAWNWADDYK